MWSLWQRGASSETNLSHMIGRFFVFGSEKRGGEIRMTFEEASIGQNGGGVRG